MMGCRERHAENQLRGLTAMGLHRLHQRGNILADGKLHLWQHGFHTRYMGQNFSCLLHQRHIAYRCPRTAHKNSFAGAAVLLRRHLTDALCFRFCKSVNFRRRTARERDNTYADAFEVALSAFLPVVDNLERAAQYGDSESVGKGVALVLKSVGETLARLGVSEIEALGKEFDPQYHNAVMHVDDPEVGESIVVDVLQKGYIKGERVLRYAMVKVAN